MSFPSDPPPPAPGPESDGPADVPADAPDGRGPVARPEPWRLAAEARGLESRVREMLDTAERVAAERLDAARAAADAIVEAALREAEEIRRAARGDVRPVPRADDVPPPPPRLRVRMFPTDGDAERARVLAEELMLGGLGRVRIEAELHQRYPHLAPETLDAILASLLMPPAAAAEGAA